MINYIQLGELLSDMDLMYSQIQLSGHPAYKIVFGNPNYPIIINVLLYPQVRVISILAYIAQIEGSDIAIQSFKQKIEQYDMSLSIGYITVFEEFCIHKIDNFLPEDENQSLELIRHILQTMTSLFEMFETNIQKFMLESGCHGNFGIKLLQYEDEKRKKEFYYPSIWGQVALA